MMKSNKMVLLLLFLVLGFFAPGFDSTSDYEYCTFVDDASLRACNTTFNVWTVEQWNHSTGIPRPNKYDRYLIMRPSQLTKDQFAAASLSFDVPLGARKLWINMFMNLTSIPQANLAIVRQNGRFVSYITTKDQCNYEWEFRASPVFITTDGGEITIEFDTLYRIGIEKVAFQYIVAHKGDDYCNFADDSSLRFCNTEFNVWAVEQWNETSGIPRPEYHDHYLAIRPNDLSDEEFANASFIFVLPHVDCNAVWFNVYLQMTNDPPIDPNTPVAILADCGSADLKPADVSGSYWTTSLYFHPYTCYTYYRIQLYGVYREAIAFLGLQFISAEYYNPFTTIPTRPTQTTTPGWRTTTTPGWRTTTTPGWRTTTTPGWRTTTTPGWRTTTTPGWLTTTTSGSTSRRTIPPSTTSGRRTTWYPPANSTTTTYKPPSTTQNHHRQHEEIDVEVGDIDVKIFIDDDDED